MNSSFTEAVHEGPHPFNNDCCDFFNSIQVAYDNILQNIFRVIFAKPKMGHKTCFFYHFF